MGVETTSNTLEEVSTQSIPEDKEDTTSSSANNTSIKESNQPSKYEVLRATAMAEKERASLENLDKVPHTRNEP